MFLGNLTKPAITIAGVDVFFQKFGDLIAVRRSIVEAEFY